MALLGWNLPRITGGTESKNKEIQEIKEYMYQLTEQLRYILQNIDEDNFNSGFSDTLNAEIKNQLAAYDSTARGVTASVNALSGKISELRDDIPTKTSQLENDAGFIGDANKEAFIAEITDRLFYTDVSYIQSDGTAYILLDFIPTSNTRVVCEMEYTPTTSNLFLFGSRTTTTSNSFTFSNYSDKVYRHSFGSNYDDFASSVKPEGKFKVDKNRNVCTINDEYVVTLEEAVFEGEYEMAIFGVNTKGTIGSKTKAKLCNMQIYENDVLVRNLITRKHLIDGYGLFDTVTRKFYGNAHTSGSFTGG